MSLKLRNNSNLGYILLEPPLGAGASGIVFLAEITHSRDFLSKIKGQKVAIKMIQYKSEETRRDFIKETDLLINLMDEEDRCSLFLPCIYERFVYNDGDTHYLTVVMRYIKGIGLDKYLDSHYYDQQPIPRKNIINLMWWLYNAVCFIHSRGVVHRDIKPANIILEEEKNILVLVDFGFGCDITVPPKTIMACRGRAGTPPYVSPEVWNSRKLTYKILMAHDVWAATAVFYELANPSHNNPFYDMSKGIEQDELIRRITRLNKMPFLTKDWTFDVLINSVFGVDDFKQRPSACKLYYELDKLKNEQK